MTLQEIYNLVDSQSYYSHTNNSDEIWSAIDKAGLRIYLWIKKELRNYFIKWDTTTIQTVIGQDEYSCPPDLSSMIRFGERLPGETNYRRIQPTEPTTDLFAQRQYETIVLSLDLLCSDFLYIGPYLPREAGPSTIMVLDVNGRYWQFAVNDAGISAPSRYFPLSAVPAPPFLLNDHTNATTWQLTVSPVGVASWTAATYNGNNASISPCVIATRPSGLPAVLNVDINGNLTTGLEAQGKEIYKVRLAPIPQDFRQTELIYNAKYLPIFNANCYNTIPEEGHHAMLDLAVAHLLLGNSDDLAAQFETKGMQELTEFLTFIRERQTQQPAEQMPYLQDLD